MRRRSEIQTGGPPKIRSSSVIGLNGVRSNVQIEDVVSAKRVKFLDPESDCQPNVRPKEPAVLNKPMRDPESHAPKTSEFAYFKKLKKNAGCSRSYASQKGENQLKTSEPGGCSRGISEELKNIGDNSKSSFPVQEMRSITKTLLLSSLGNASNNSEAAKVVDEDSNKDMRSPLFVERVNPSDHSFLFSPLGGASKASGTERLDGILSGKRKRLRQWVASTSLHNTEKSCSEGCDLVHLLINRLFPDTAETNYCRNEKPMEMGTDNKFSSYAFPKLHTGDMDCHWTPKRDLWETKYGCYSDDVCNRSLVNLEMVPLEWATEGCDAPSAKYASRSHFQFGKEKFSADYEGDIPSIITIQDPYLCINTDIYESTASRHIKGLNDFPGIEESVNGKGPPSLLLGWDADGFEDKGDLSITKWNAEKNSTMAASWDDHQQSLDNCSVESELDIFKGLNDFPGIEESVHGKGPSSLLLGWDVDGFEDKGGLSITKWNADMNSTMAASWDDRQQSLDNCSVESELDTFKGLNDFPGIEESVNGKGPSSLLLGWDVDGIEDKGGLSITKWNAEMNSTMAASWDDHQQSLDNCSVESELDTSSFLFNYPSQLALLPNPHSAPFSNIDEEKFLLAELKRFPLSLPWLPTCHNPLKASDTYDTCDGSSYFSPLNHRWVIGKVLREKHHRDVEAFVRPFGLGCDLGWTHLSIADSFRELYSPSYECSPFPSKESQCSYLLAEEPQEDCFSSLNHSQNMPYFHEDTVNSQERCCTNFWIPTGKEMPTPLLLDSPSWLRTEEDISHDNS